MRHSFLIGLLLIAFGATAAAAGASSRMTTTTASTTEWSAAKKRAARPAPPLRIACTQAGCIPVPPGCSTIWERDWDDSPTGMEIIVCPPR